MFRIPRILLTLIILVVAGLSSSSCTTTTKSCNLKVNKKKLSYYNSLQYKGASRKRH